MNETIIIPKQSGTSTEEGKRSFKPGAFRRDAFDASRHPRRAAFWDVTLLFVVSRLLFVLVTYIGVPLFTQAKYSSKTTTLQFLIASWNHWDAANYTRIAQFGYQSTYDFAFFPSFPYAIHLLGSCIGNYMVAGLLLSNLAFYGAMLALYALVVGFSQDTQIARRTLLYLALFPTAFYLFAAYNESFFIFFAATMFLALQRRMWLLAGFMGLFAALTRSAGALLALPYLLTWWFSRDKSKPFFSLSWIVRLLPIILIPVGTIIYMIYCYNSTGDALAFATVQNRWGRATSVPWLGIWLTLQRLFTEQPFASFFQVHMLLDLTATIIFIVLTVIGWRYVPRAFTLMSACFILLVLLSPSIQGDPLTSNQRFVIELFPAYITLAFLGQRYPRLHQGIMVAFPMLLSILTILFLENKWMV